MWQWLETHAAAILERDDTVLAELVYRSLAIKATVVEADEREAGRRAILNAGHTAAHALEHATQFGLRHGEAVAIGLVMESRIAEERELAAKGTTARIASLLGRLGLPTVPPADMDTGAFRAALGHDKKNRDGAVHAALLADIGSVARSARGGWTQAIDPDRLTRFIQGN
jgi:3-dehydroquinate synthetase